jgi:hypothetical protein
MESKHETPAEDAVNEPAETTRKCIGCGAPVADGEAPPCGH